MINIYRNQEEGNGYLREVWQVFFYATFERERNDIKAPSG